MSMHVNRSRSLARAALLSALSGCGAGTAGIVSGASGGGGGGDSPVISELTVVDRKEPAIAAISFALSRAAQVEFLFKLEGEADPRPMQQIGTNPVDLSTTVTPLPWNFSLERDASGQPLGERLHPGVTVIARPRGGAEAMKVLPLGNDPPGIELIDPGTVGSDDVPFELLVRDTPEDLVQVRVQFDVLGDAAGWQDATPVVPVERIEIQGDDPEPFPFLWDSDADLLSQDQDVVLRFTPVEIDPEDDEVVVQGVAVEKQGFRVNNNAEPTADILEVELFANPDERRGIPVRYRVSDREEDPVRVVLQWRREDEPDFLPLETDVTVLTELLLDPVRSREQHVCTPYPGHLHGKVAPVGDAGIRLDDLPRSAAFLLGEPAGRRLEILRASTLPAPQAGDWERNPLSAPVAALPLDGGVSALVLDGAGPWRLDRIELATGACTPVAESVSGGSPGAMAFEPGGRSVLVASHLGGSWLIERVDLASHAIQSIATGLPGEGPVRGIASLGARVNAKETRGTGSVLITTGNRLRRVSWNETDSAVATVLAGLSMPWGVVLDPLREGRAYVAERRALAGRGEGRILSVELETGAVELLAGDPVLPRPTAIALEAGTRLLVLCQPFDGDRFELRAVQIAGERSGESVVLTRLPEAVVLPEDAPCLATGPDLSRLIPLPRAADLLVGGGVEQARTISTYDRASHTAQVDLPFDPPLRLEQTWRIVPPHPFFDPAPAPATGAVRAFLWDSGDVPGGGRIFLRAVPLDAEAGTEGRTGIAKRVAHAWSRRVDVALPGTGSAVSVAAGDLDEDGLPDLVTADYGPNRISVLRNPLDPFPVPQDLRGSTEIPLTKPRVVVLAHLDDDGALDIVSANPGSGNLTVFLREPGGAFGTGPTRGLYEARAGNPQAVAAADVDGDGDVDLVSANHEGSVPDSGYLTVFRQGPPGEFSPLEPSTDVGGLPNSLTIADLDGDGVQDLAAAVGGSHPVITLRLQAPPRGRAIQLETAPNSVVVADMNGDGQPDLLAATRNDLRLYFGLEDFLERGVPLREESLSDLVTFRPTSLGVADLDRDGDLDVVSANAGTDTLTAFFQSRCDELDTTPFEPSPMELRTARTPRSVVASDMDGDGRIDLAAGCEDAADDDLNVFLQAGLYAAAPTSLSGSTTQRPAATAHADLDGDGDLDLVSANDIFSVTESDLLSVFLQTAPATFTLASTLAGFTTPRWVQAADLDDDGDLDLVSANVGSDDVALFSQLVPGGFASAPELLGGLANPIHGAVADLDQDGDLDLVLANAGGDYLSVHSQRKRGVFLTSRLGRQEAMSAPRAVIAADVDGDGRVDLVAASPEDNSLILWSRSDTADPGSSDGSQIDPPPDRKKADDPFDVLAILEDVPGPVSLVAGDFDGNGTLDLATASLGDRLTVILQLEGGTFDPERLVLGQGTLENPVFLLAGDLNDDGALDLTSANQASDTLTVFLQVMPGRFASRPLVLGGPLTLDSPQFLAAGDLDGDGDVDLVSANSGSNDLTLFWGGR